MPSLQGEFPHGGGDEDEGRGDRSVDRATEESGDDGHISRTTSRPEGGWDI